MISYLVMLVSLFCFWKLIRKDIAAREGVSKAIWIPTLWAGILLSRPVSLWLNFGGGDDANEGSPIDRLFYFGMILAAFVVLQRRKVRWGQVIRENWPIMLFYGYFLVSITWAPAPFVAFKRWFKDFGNIAIALVILTEVNPMEAFRAVFVRCAYVLIPLSVVFVRYFPDLGRRYSRAGGLEITGVTMQKNSLGVMVLVCGLVLIWDWFERTKPGSAARGRLERFLPFMFFLFGVYLLHLCNSMTATLCLTLGGGIFLVSRMPFARNRIGTLGFLMLAAILGFFALDSLFHIKGEFLQLIGRSATLTGRTEVWDKLLSLHTDPLVGDGFCSFWSDRRYLSQLPYWIGASAHNGYLEVYLDGGYVGLFFLGIVLLVTGLRLHRYLALGSNYALLRFAVFAAILIEDVSESNWGRMTPLGFIFLLTAIGHAERGDAISVPESSSVDDEEEPGEFQESFS
jgi:exopolysaccharide production protein ExoQ